jgi:uncharacterized membrane protein
MTWLKWGAFTLVLAAIIHWAAVTYAPTLIMSRAMSAVAGNAKGSNMIAHSERATAASRTIVLPSPDLLYSICSYDVSRRPLKIVTAAPTDTYWSVAMYAANTDNFYVLNDTAAHGQATTIILVGQSQTVPPQAEGTIVVSAPTPKGIVLFRTLINGEERLADLDQQRRAAKCDPM